MGFECKTKKNEESSEFFEFFINNLMIVFVLLCFSLFFSILYIFYFPKVYENRVYVDAPKASNIVLANYGRGGGSELGLISVEEVYGEFIRALQSEAARKFVIDKILATATDDPGLYAGLVSAIKVSKVSEIAATSFMEARMPSKYVIYLKGRDPSEVLYVLTQYLQSVDEIAYEEIKKRLVLEEELAVRSINQNISSLRAIAEKKRMDMIFRLKKSLDAGRSDYMEPLFGTALSGAVTNGKIVYLQSRPDIEHEIIALENIENNDPYISELPVLLAKKEFYESLILNNQRFSTFLQDGTLELNSSPVKPSILIIIVRAIIFGLMVALFVILVKYFFKCRKF